jgi:hypothetical protein
MTLFFNSQFHIWNPEKLNIHLQKISILFVPIWDFKMFTNESCSGFLLNRWESFQQIKHLLTLENRVTYSVTTEQTERLFKNISKPKTTLNWWWQWSVAGSCQGVEALLSSEMLSSSLIMTDPYPGGSMGLFLAVLESLGHIPYVIPNSTALLQSW